MYTGVPKKIEMRFHFLPVGDTQITKVFKLR